MTQQSIVRWFAPPELARHDHRRRRCAHMVVLHAISRAGRPVLACNCDSELTRRVIENLVSNAMKVTTIDGRVRVVISGSQERASISVSDEGPAVPTEQRTRIFEAYRPERLWSAAGDESSGLGLAFCRLAVEAQGGFDPDRGRHHAREHVRRRARALGSTRLTKRLAAYRRRSRGFAVDAIRLRLTRVRRNINVL